MAITTIILDKNTKCPKCFANLITQNADGDYECFCGYVFYNPKQLIPISTSTPTVKHHKLHRYGHFNKTLVKIKDVIEYYNRGLGVRQVASLLHLNKRTVLGIIHEQQPRTINLQQAELQRKKRIRDNKSGIIPALKGLASTSKKLNYSIETMFEHTDNLLQKHIKQYSKDTILSLTGDKTFSIDDIIKKSYSIVLSQRLKLDPTFERINDNTYKLKEN